MVGIAHCTEDPPHRPQIHLSEMAAAAIFRQKNLDKWGWA
jgi:hypothetical protein